MLAFFRSLAKSKFVWILLGLPMVAGLLTIGNVRADLSGIFGSKDAVIQAGSQVYGSAEFKREFEAYRRQAQQAGQPMTVQEAVAQGLDQRMLSAFSERESLSEMLRRLGVWPSDKVVAAQIAQIKQFQNPVTGQFDRTTYLQTLQQNNLTAPAFEKSLRDETAQNQFFAGLAAGLDKPPRFYGALVGAYGFEVHNLSLFALNPKALGPAPEATDDQLKQIMKDNAPALTLPEMRALTLVKFSASQLASTLAADPAEVQKRYDFRKDTLSTPETRSVVQITVKSQAQGEQVANQLKSGADPATVARGAGLQAPLVYTNASKATIADPKVADAAFALPPGAVSAPIQGNLGWAVIRITGVTPGKAASFDQEKPKIEQEVKTEAATNKAYDMSKKYEDAHEKGSTLVEAAKAVGGSPITLAPVTAQGQDADGKPVPGLSPRVLKEAFALPQGGETDVVQDSKGEYFAVRVDKILPPALPPFDKAKPRLIQAFLQREMSKRLDAKLNELSARVKKGESLDAVAQSVGSMVTHLPMTRNQAQQSRNLRPEQLQQIFTAKAGDVITTGAVVAKVDSIEPPTPGIIAATIPAGQQTLARAIFDELQQESRTWSRNQVKPKINIDLARQAIGANPADAHPGQTGLVSPASPAGAAQ